MPLRAYHDSQSCGSPLTPAVSSPQSGGMMLTGAPIMTLPYEYTVRPFFILPLPVRSRADRLKWHILTMLRSCRSQGPTSVRISVSRTWPSRTPSGSLKCTSVKPIGSSHGMSIMAESSPEERRNVSGMRRSPLSVKPAPRREGWAADEYWEQVEMYLMRPAGCLSGKTRGEASASSRRF